MRISQLVVKRKLGTYSFELKCITPFGVSKIIDKLDIIKSTEMNGKGLKILKMMIRNLGILMSQRVR